MKVEQPRELNALLEECRPLTWSGRWLIFRSYFRLLLPLLAFSSVGALEIMFWADTLSLPKLLFCIALPVSLPSFVLVMTEIGSKINFHSKRVLEIRDQGIKLNPGGIIISWHEISLFRFEPMVDRLNLVKLAVEYRDKRKTKVINRCWPMVLSKAEQMLSLSSELTLRQQMGKGAFVLKQFTEPVISQASPPPKITILPLWLWMIGFYFILHGLPILGASIFKTTDQPVKSHSHRTVSPKRAEQFARFIIKSGHIHNFQEFRRFSMICGSAMTGIGIVFFIWSTAAERKFRKHQPVEAQDKTASNPIIL